MTSETAAQENAAERAAVEVRGWALDGASVIEVTDAGAQPRFFVHCGGSWMACVNLEASMSVVWQQSRSRAHLPPQWTTPGSDILEGFERHWGSLRALAEGQWWPAAPRQPLHGGAGG